MNLLKIIVCFMCSMMYLVTSAAQTKNSESLPFSIENIECGKLSLTASADHSYQYDFRIKKGKIHKLKIRNRDGNKVKTKPVNMQFVEPMCLTTQPVSCTTVLHGDGSESVVCWCGDRFVWRLPDNE